MLRLCYLAWLRRRDLVSLLQATTEGRQLEETIDEVVLSTHKYGDTLINVMNFLISFIYKYIQNTHTP